MNIYKQLEIKAQPFESMFTASKCLVVYLVSCLLNHNLMGLLITKCKTLHHKYFETHIWIF